MAAQTDFLLKKFGPLRSRNLEQALVRLLARELPPLGGERVVRLCAQIILEFLARHQLTRDTVGHGQVLWLAVARDHRPARGQRIADTQLVPVVLDLCTADDLDARLARRSAAQRLCQRAVRLCQQSYQQGGLLGNCDLAELLCCADSEIAHVLVDYEQRTQSLVPRRATLHDVGTGLTHKRIICWKRFAEGKEPPQVARETYHSLAAVDHYLAQFDRVRYCRQLGMSAAETAHVLDRGLPVVHEYLLIAQQLEEHAVQPPAPTA